MPWTDFWSSPAKEDRPIEEKEHTQLLPKNEPKPVDHETAYSTKLNDQLGGLEPLAQTSRTTLQTFTQPQTILATVVLTTVCLGGFRLYRKYLRRIPEATNIHPSFLRRRSVFGKVTSVGDGDNFRIYHTPGGRLAGWGWLPGRKVPTDRKELKNQTIHVRIAGIDAPELAHFGRPAQPYSSEALDWLTKYVLGRRVRAYVHKQDQYSRVVATVYIWKGFFRRDVGLQMLRSGLATIYEAKSGAEFGDGLEQKYRNAEWWAKTRRKGMWAANKHEFESPREYKTRYGNSNGTT